MSRKRINWITAKIYAEIFEGSVQVMTRGQEPIKFDRLLPGGDSAYETGGDARRKFWIKPLKETDLGVAQALFDP